MLFGEIIRVALQSIQANFFRAMLTMLGIIIGVSAVIAMLAAGAGAQKRIDDQIASLGANILNVTASRFFSMGVARDQLTLSVDDVEPLETESRYLDAVIPEITGRGQLKYLNRNTNVRVTGTAWHYADVFNYDLAVGRFFTLEEDEAKRRVVVVGAEIPQQLEVAAADLIDQSIAINNQPFRVVGVLASAGGGGFGNRGPDSNAFIPLNTAAQRLFGQEELDSISVRVLEDIRIERAMVDIERVLRKAHRLLPGQPNDFAIVDRREFLETQQEAQQTFTVLLASIAGVSLIVGGIGIMNIMLVSVTERTREIGIRMALGATRGSILLQFLVESVTLCLLGGLLGIGLGAAASSLMSRFAGWEVFVSPESVGLAFAFSVGVGLFFGIWPARRAARLNPIEALRYE
ncbi:MAG: ABC transporter permease [Gammaproteobacteria bacterium]|nr:ABC transporter permease [Gammaproteobacteria bacterium]